ncbi:hypothetical protein SBV1_110013 [Verrucomicrobia bacterium]|nr:hypothetical protein SBV1_110013 [Verrucomicrobiota bacterium]
MLLLPKICAIAGDEVQTNPLPACSLGSTLGILSRGMVPQANPSDHQRGAGH